MKLFEHPETDKTLDRLPELPPGVQVPDDISGLEPPTTKRTAGGVRWMRWLAAIVVLGAAGIVTAVLVSNGSDTEQAPVDYMQMYGTDNPTFVDGAPGPGTVTIVAPQSSYMDLYGTDNPVFVPGTDTGTGTIELPSGTGMVVPDSADADEYMTLYGTDNPEFLPEPSYMDLYGTDNPTIVEE